MSLVDAAIRKAVVWLGRRGRTVSKHVQGHGRTLANAARNRPWFLTKAVHTVFRTTNVDGLILRALRNPTQKYLQRNGKVCVEYVFNKVIGRDGERIIRVIIDPRTGRVITAFPVESLSDAAARAASRSGLRAAARLAAGGTSASVSSASALVVPAMAEHLDAMFSEADQVINEARQRYPNDEDGNGSWLEFLGDALDFTGIGFFSPSRAGNAMSDIIVPQLNGIASRYARQIQTEVEVESGSLMNLEDKRRLLRILNDSINGHLLHQQ